MNHVAKNFVIFIHTGNQITTLVIECGGSELTVTVDGTLNSSNGSNIICFSETETIVSVLTYLLFNLRLTFYHACNIIIDNSCKNVRLTPHTGTVILISSLPFANAANWPYLHSQFVAVDKVLSINDILEYFV